MSKPWFVMVWVGTVLVAWGCGSVPGGEEPTGLPADVAAKADEVVQQIGGQSGFGGPYMTGYAGHMTAHMGFHGAAYLADPDGDLTVELANSSGFPCTFHLAYVRNSDGTAEQTVPVVVDDGEVVTFTMPCAEIVGAGSLTDVGAPAAEWSDGTAFGNRYCVPGFLNSDYACGGTYRCAIAPDVDDLDQDGDTAELIVVSSSLQAHMRSGGMGQHMWEYQGTGGGMMGGLTGPARSPGLMMSGRP